MEGKGFVEAQFLLAGDSLRLATGKEATVEEVWQEAQDEKVLVYNFEVADYHTYFVAELGVLVHNANYGASSSNKTIYNKIVNVADNYKLSESTYQTHILARHGSNSRYSNKSHFNINFDIKGGIDSTLKGNKSIIKGNTNGRSGYIFEKKFNKVIGTDTKGKPLYTLKVVIDEFGNVITAFKVKRSISFM